MIAERYSTPLLTPGDDTSPASLWSETGRGRGGARVTLPSRLGGAVIVEDAASRLSLTFLIRGADDVPAEEVSGDQVYRRGRGPGSNVLFARTATGVEDFTLLEAAPARDELHYEVDVSDFAGLRLVGNQLEFLDAQGAPRLRVAPPYIVDSKGSRRDAQLAVDDCEVDTNPAAPWDRAVVAPGAAHCVVRVTWEGAALVYPVLVDPLWQATGDMAVARSGHVAGVLVGDDVLVAGGGAELTAELYDPATGTWAMTGSMATGFANAATVLLDGKVLVTNNSVNPELYDAATGTWGPTGTCSYPHVFHTASRLADGRVLVAGGHPGTPGSNITEIFDPASGSWSLTGAMATYRHHHAAVVLQDGRVFTAGGHAPKAANPAVSSAEIYDPATGSWTYASGMTYRRQNLVATLLPNGTVLVTGGFQKDPGQEWVYFAEVEIYDPSADTWSMTGSMSVSRANHTAILLAGKEVLVAGGQIGVSANPITAAVDRYDTATGAWSTTESMTRIRVDHTATLLPGDRVLVAGGQSDGGLTPAAEIFALYGQGIACDDESICASGHCVDGVCCDSSCNGFCEACSATQKGNGLNGSCGPIAAGLDPGEECYPLGPSFACQTPGTCDGNGDCTTRAGENCSPSACEDIAHVTMSTCTAQGVCIEQIEPCFPFSCHEGACKTECESDVDCAFGHTCAEEGTCLSSLGLCKEGHFATLPNGTIKENCSPFNCNADGECKTSCSSVRDCAPPNACNVDGHCVPRSSLDIGEASGCSSSPEAAHRGESRPGAAWLVAILYVAARQRSARRRIQ